MATAAAGIDHHATVNHSDDVVSGSPGEWTIFMVAFTLLMIFDSYYLMRGKATMTLRESCYYVLFYFICALFFFWWIAVDRGINPAFQWSTGYMLEWMLSVDNLFVYRVIFEMYKCPDYLQQKPLFFGIIGVIVLRLLLFVVGEVLYHSVAFVYLILGAFLIYTGIKVVFTDDDDDDDDPTQGCLIQWLQKRVPLIGCYDQDGRFFVQVIKGSDLSASSVAQEVELSTAIAGAADSNSSSCEEDGNDDAARGQSPVKNDGKGDAKVQVEGQVIGKVEAPKTNDSTGGSPTERKAEGAEEGSTKKSKLVRRFEHYGKNQKTAYDPVTKKPAELETRCTLSFLVALCLAATDVIFAVDSASAIIAQIPDIYLAYTACAVATLGLRATFFMVSELINIFKLLKYGVGFVLVFTGGKLMLGGVVDVPDIVTAGVMISTFFICTVGSLIVDKCRKEGIKRFFNGPTTVEGKSSDKTPEEITAETKLAQKIAHRRTVSMVIGVTFGYFLMGELWVSRYEDTVTQHSAPDLFGAHIARDHVVRGHYFDIRVYSDKKSLMGKKKKGKKKSKAVKPNV